MKTRTTREYKEMRATRKVIDFVAVANQEDIAILKRADELAHQWQRVAKMGDLVINAETGEFATERDFARVRGILSMMAESCGAHFTIEDEKPELECFEPNWKHLCNLCKEM